MFIGFILLKVVISLKCTTFNNDTLEIYATQNEIIKMSFSEIFLFKDYTNITIENSLGLLSIASPISILEQKMFDSQNMKSFSLLINDLSYEWLNKFAALIYTNNQYIIQLSQQNNQGQNGRMPTFQTASQPIYADVCFDAVFISKNIIAADCMNAETNGGIQNIFYLWNNVHQNFTAVENDNFKGYTKDIRRKSLSANQQIYRCSIFNIDHTEFNSLLEVFSLEGKLTHYLDSEELTNLLQIEYQLKILDFRVSNLGQVAILNQNNDILVLNYSIREKIWKILHRFEHQAQVKAFDFNFKEGTYLLYYGDSLLYQSKINQFQYQLPSITSVFLTNQRIIASYNNIIFLFDKTLNLIQKEQLDSLSLIVNDHTKDDLLIFSNDKILRFFLHEDYYLKYLNLETDTDEKISHIKQKLTNQSVCELIIFHQTVSTNNEVIFVSQKNGNIISEFIPTYPANYSLKFNKHSVYGTNLKYQFTSINNTAEMLQITSKTYEKYNIQLNETLQQSSAWLLNSDTEIFLVIQYQNNLLEVQICSSQFECKQELEIMLDFQLNEQNSCFWVGSKGLFIAIYQNNLIQINFLKSKTLNQLFEILQEFKIDKLIYNGIFIVFSQTEMTITTYYISTVGYLKQYILNSQTVADLGILDWQPKQVFSILSSPHIYLINKETDVLIISCTLLEYKIIQLINFAKPVESVFAFTNSFIVYFDSQLILYNQKDEANIHYQKTIPLFGYSINKILSHTAQGWIYIVTDQQKLLTINMNNLNVNSLWHVTPINNSDVINSIKDYIFVDNQIIKFYHQINLLSNAEIYSTNFLNKICLQVQISNPKSQYFVNFNQTIQNQQTQIRFDQSKLNLDKVLDQKSQENYCQNLSNEWLQNTVNNLEIKCPDCGKEITLKENIQLKGAFQIQNGIDFLENGNDKLIILQIQNLLILTNNQQLIQNISFAEENLKCTNILFADQLLIVLKCYDTASEYFLVQLIQEKDQFIFGEKLVTKSDLISIELIDQELFLIYPNTVELYQRNQTSLNQFIKIEKWELDGKVLKIHKISTFYHLYYQDLWLFIIEFQILPGVVLQIQTYAIDLNELFIGEGYYSHSDKWLKLFILNQSETQKLLYVDYLFVSEVGVHFAISFVFNCTSQCQLQQNKIINIIQNYGDWIALDSKFCKNWFGVLYSKEKDQTLSIYQIPQTSNQNAVTQIGGLTYKNSQLVQFNFINQNNEVILATNDKDALNLFSQNTERQLCMNGKIEKQSIQLIASNDFSQSQQEFNIDIRYNYYKFWGLWLFIAVIIIGIGIGFWCWRKRKNAKKDILLLG